MPLVQTFVSAPSTLFCVAGIGAQYIPVEGLNTLSVNKFSSNGS